MAKELVGTYKDATGEEAVVIQISDDGRELSTVIRGTEFNGIAFDSFSPSKKDSQLNSFSISDENYLHSFSLLLETAIIVDEAGQKIEGQLKIDCTINSPAEEWEDSGYLQFTVNYNDKSIQSEWFEAGFEDELRNLHSLLPENIFLECCYNCKYSSYYPFWNSGLMGELWCFVKTKDKYVPRNKGENWDINGVISVQEIHFCSEFVPDEYCRSKEIYRKFI